MTGKHEKVREHFGRVVALTSFSLCIASASGATKPELDHMRTEQNSPVVRHESHKADFVVCGGSCGYSWTAPIRASSIRIVFDTDLMRHRRMPVEEDFSRAVMPPMLARRFRVEVRKNGVWSVCHETDENFSRVCRISFDPVETDSIRLVVEKTWGGSKAHVFGLDVADKSVGD